jgi:hypothetical protein
MASLRLAHAKVVKPYFENKNTHTLKNKRNEGMDQMAEYFPARDEALGSILSTEKKVLTLYYMPFTNLI